MTLVTHENGVLVVCLVVIKDKNPRGGGPLCCWLLLEWKGLVPQIHNRTMRNSRRNKKKKHNDNGGHEEEEEGEEDGGEDPINA